MKFTNTMLVCLSIIIAVMLGTYFYKFSNFTFFNFPFFEFKSFGKLSQDSQDWANFGTYIGGTLGPIGAFLAFWGLMQQNMMYRDNIEIERLTTKLVLVDADILTLTQIFFTTTPEQVEKANTEPLTNRRASLHQLMVNNYIDMIDIIYSKPSQDIQTGFTNVNPHDKILESLKKQLILMNNFIKKVQHIDPNSIEITHYNAKYQNLLEEMHKKKWINFNSFGS